LSKIVHWLVLAHERCSKSENQPQREIAWARYMKILVYGINYAPDLVGISKYTTEMCQHFSRCGHDVKVVTAPPYYPSWRITRPYKGYTYQSETSGRVHIVRCPLYVPKSQNAVRRILHHLSFALASAPVMMISALRFRPDVVLAIAPSLLGAPGAILAARLAGAATWLHIKDFEIDAAFDLGFLSGSYFKQVALFAERSFFRMFDVVSTISPKMMSSLESKGVSPERRLEFRDWVDTTAIRPLQKNESLRPSLNFPDHSTVVLYSGSMGAKQGVEYLAATAERLQSLRPEVRFLLCGSGPMKGRLRDMTSHLSNVVLMDLQPVELFGRLLSTADIHLLPQRPEIKDSVLPGKLAAMLASGRPVVAMASAGTQLHAELEGAGIVVAPGDIDGFVDAIVKLADNDDLRRSMGSRGREIAESQWDRSAILARVETKLQDLCRHSQRRSFKDRPLRKTQIVKAVELQNVDGEAS
jgi:colanic acid biosynthesis glycosyl transferase WcaI